MADNPITSKYYQGTFAGGQGPTLGQTNDNTGETQSQFGGEGKENIKTVDQGGTDNKPTGGAANFDLQGSSYAGPENWTPEDKGTVSPSEIKGK